MTKISHHFQKLSNINFFQEIEKKVAQFQTPTPKELINLGIAEVSIPLFPKVLQELTNASQELGDKETLRSYGPSNGYLFLRSAIAENEYQNICADEIFISDGADVCSIQEIFSPENKIAIADPTYPIFEEASVIGGRTRSLLKTGRYGGVTYLPCTEANGFQPTLPLTPVDLIYLASPSNPTGVALTRQTLETFVAYAKKNRAVILFDGTYEKFITSDAPRSIYEIKGAKEVAIELRSFSKSAGFTSLRCGYTVIPFDLKVQDAGAIHSLNKMWKRRLETTSNGISYPIQRAASALYTPEGSEQMKQAIAAISARAKFLLEGLKALGYTVYGGVDSPFIWCKTPPKISSWEFFHFLLENAHMISTPGIGFGLSGEGFIRLSAFSDTVQISLNRFKMLA